MEIVITGRHTEVPERFRRLAEEKLAKIGQVAPKAHRADVELSHERNPRQSQTCEKVEITVRGKGPVIRAEASAEDPAAALDLAFGKLIERLRRSRDRRKVHHGRQTPPSVRQVPVARAALAALAPTTSGSPAVIADADAVTGNGAAPFVDLSLTPSDDAGVARADGAGGPRVGRKEVAADERVEERVLEGGGSEGGGSEADGSDSESPVVIRTKDHRATPMTLDQALYEMELVGHDFFLFVDAESGRPSVVYRRRGWSYGVIRLEVTAAEVDPSAIGTQSR